MFVSLWEDLRFADLRHTSVLDLRPIFPFALFNTTTIPHFAEMQVWIISQYIKRGS